MAYNPYFTFTGETLRSNISRMVRIMQGRETRDILSDIMHELNQKIQYYADSPPDLIKPLRVLKQGVVVTAGWAGGLDLGTLDPPCRNLCGVGDTTHGQYITLTPQSARELYVSNTNTADNPAFMWTANNKLLVFNGTATNTEVWIDYIKEPKKLVVTIADATKEIATLELGNMWGQVLVYQIAADLLDAGRDDKEALNRRDEFRHMYELLYQNIMSLNYVPQTGNPIMNATGKTGLAFGRQNGSQ